MLGDLRRNVNKVWKRENRSNHETEMQHTGGSEKAMNYDRLDHTPASLPVSLERRQTPRRVTRACGYCRGEEFLACPNQKFCCWSCWYNARRGADAMR